MPSLTTPERLSALDAFVGTKKRRKQARPTFNGDAASQSSTENTEDDDLDERGARRHGHNNTSVFKSEYQNRTSAPKLQCSPLTTTNEDQSFLTTCVEPVRFVTSLQQLSENNCSNQTQNMENDAHHRLPIPELLPITSTVSTALSPPQVSFAADVLPQVQHYGPKIASPPAFLSSSSPNRYLSSSPAVLTPGLTKRGGGGGEDPTSDGELDAEGLLMEGSGAGQAEVCPQCRKVCRRCL